MIYLTLDASKHVALDIHSYENSFFMFINYNFNLTFTFSPCRRRRKTRNQRNHWIHVYEPNRRQIDIASQFHNHTKHSWHNFHDCHSNLCISWNNGKKNFRHILCKLISTMNILGYLRARIASSEQSPELQWTDIGTEVSIYFHFSRISWKLSRR